MRFKPGTTNAEAKAKLAAFAEKQRTRNAGPVNKPPVLPPRPSTPMTQRPVQPPPSQVNPTQPNIMGFPDRPMNAGGGLSSLSPQQLIKLSAQQSATSQSPPPGVSATRESFLNDMRRSEQQMQQGAGGARLPIGVGPSMPVTQQQMQTMAQEEMQRMGLFGRPGGMPPRPSGMPMGIAPMGRPGGPVNMGGLGQGRSSVNTTTQSDIMGRPRPNSGGFNPANMQQGLQSLAAQNNPQAVAKPAFKKGGKVSAKAPVKKAAGGKVAAKAPVKKAMGGKVAAKPMPAMKRGGKVMMKGKYK